MWTIPCNPPSPTRGDEARGTLRRQAGASAALVKNQVPDTAEELQPTGSSAAKISESKQGKTRPARSLLIDAVRGMAICLVALGHTNQGIQHRGWWGASNVGFRLDVIIYAFHMPAFFFVSGIFLCASVQKRGPVRFTLERIRTLIYPYLLWSLISAGSVRVLSQFVAQQPMTLKQFLMDLLIGGGIWFLPALFLCQMLGMSLRKLPGAAIFGIAVAIYYFYPVTGVTFVNLGLEFFPFVAAGMWVGRNYERMERVPRWLAFACSVVLLGVLWVAMYKPWTSYRNIVLLGGVIGTLMLIMLARSFGGSKLAKVFAWAGEASLAIYLAGEYGQGLVRQLLLWAHIIEPYTQLILPTIAAIVIPAWIYQHRVRLHLEWLFIAPFWKPRPRAPQSASVA
jgi:fucose 4-O-acetylase-like acetyltransferase